MNLTGAILKSEGLVTGLVIGVLGVESSSGHFEVLDVAYPCLPPQPAMPELDQDVYIALVSGLNVGEESTYGLQIQLLIDYLNGELGSPQDIERVSKITRVIFAGNSLVHAKPMEDPKKSVRRLEICWIWIHVSFAGKAFSYSTI